MRPPLLVLLLLLVVIALSGHEHGRAVSSTVKVDYDSDYARCIRQMPSLHAFECDRDSKVSNDVHD